MLNNEYETIQVNEKTIRVYECEDTVDGILTGIYKAWDAAYGHSNIRLVVPSLQKEATYDLFSDYYQIESDPMLAGKVANTIRTRFSERVRIMMYRALYSTREDKADAVYHMLVQALKVGDRIIDQLADPYVRAVFEMNREVGFEEHHYLGFLRFEECKNGVLVGRFEPKNDLVECVAPHFADRFSGENFVIVDTKRQKAAIHAKDCPYIVREVTKEEMEYFTSDSVEESNYQLLWNTFFKTIAIQERKNEKLQRNNLPLRYRKYMTEM